MLQDAESWIVHDRGADDLRLFAAATGRTAYLFDEATGRVQRDDGHDGRAARASSPRSW